MNVFIAFTSFVKASGAVIVIVSGLWVEARAAREEASLEAADAWPEEEREEPREIRVNFELEGRVMTGREAPVTVSEAKPTTSVLAMSEAKRLV